MNLEQHGAWTGTKIDHAFSAQHIVPLQPLRDAVPAELLQLYFGWLDAYSVSFNVDSSPWVPIGNVGPVILVGHHRPETKFPLPGRLFQKAVIPEAAYAKLAAFTAAQYERRRPWTGFLPLVIPTESFPPIIGEPAALRCIADHMFAPDMERAQLTRALSKGTGTIVASDLPDGYGEAAKFLLGKIVLVDVRSVSFATAAYNAVQETVRIQHNVAPFYSTDDCVYVASPSVPNRIASDTLNAMLGMAGGKRRQIRLVLAALPHLKDTINTRTALQRGAEALKSASVAGNEPGQAVTDQSESDIVINEEEMRTITVTPGLTPNQTLFHWILYMAIRSGASDIHFEQAKGAGTVRIRKDGSLQLLLNLPNDVSRGLLGVVKNGELKGLKANNFDTQDCRGTVKIGMERYGLRVNLIPHLRDTHQVMVIRILAKTSRLLSQLEKLGMSEWHLSVLRRAITRREGLILVTGPTGHGKTTTLYACLREINRPDVKINTIEDPVEIELDGATQSMPDEDHGIKFSDLNAAVLRQDPDIILVGELRDKDSTETALKLAETGHLVFATLHTKSEIDAISRVVDMAGDRTRVHVLARSLVLVQAQRLVEKLCPDCSTEVPATPEEMLVLAKHGHPNVRRLKVAKVAKEGTQDVCQNCRGTGYVGRTCVMGLLPITRKISNLILKGGDPDEIADEAQRSGFITLFDDALRKVVVGEISMSEAEPMNDPWEEFFIKENAAKPLREDPIAPVQPAIESV